ncbi:MAG: D-arabinono-1,4-lactone oxidase [Bacteroidota bacterium]
MKNWSGNQIWQPNTVFYPDSETAVQAIVQRATTENRKVRIIGTGHSFTPLSKTEDFLISLDKYQGVIRIDQDKQQVTVKAGTKLHYLNELLFKEGLALENMGDINVQSIAGATATGTHGTGTAFGNMSTQIVGLRFVNGKGEIVECSLEDQPDLFKAAQISLGALGIITAISLQCVPLYRLQLVIDKERLNDVLANYARHNIENRNYEYFWFPHSEYVMTKKSNLTDEAADPSGFKDYFQEVILENYSFKLVCELSYRFPALSRQLSRFSANTISRHVKVSNSHQVFSTSRMVRFNEMEYNVPIEAYSDVKKEIVSWVNKHHPEIMFPIENRFVKGDDIYLSPAYQRDSAYIAVHVYSKKDYRPYFKALEAIFKAYDGRPHWGKLHTLTQDELKERYPKFFVFQQFREEQDPQGIFLSPYLRTLF